MKTKRTLNKTHKTTTSILFYWLTIISISFFLFSGKISRTAYYLLTYISIANTFYLILKDKKIIFYWIPTLFLILGLSKFIWAISTTNNQYPLIEDHYYVSGKRMILGSFILYVIYRLHSEWYFPITLIKTGTILLIIMMITITGFGIQEILETGKRPNINSDSATSGAYMFTLMALTTLWSIKKSFKTNEIFLSIFILILSFILLSISGTRSAIILFSAFCIINITYLSIKKPKKIIQILLYIIIILATIKTLNEEKCFEYLFHRIQSVFTEINNYQEGNKNSSIGARIAMWQAGLSSFTQNIFGQSADERNIKAKKWINTHQPSNKIALLNIQYHTHNDIVESFSLQGIFGGIIMISFFLGFFLTPLFEKKICYENLFLSIPVIYFSMGDSQFYNRESPYFILLISGYFMILRRTSTHF